MQKLPSFCCWSISAKGGILIERKEGRKSYQEVPYNFYHQQCRPAHSVATLTWRPSDHCCIQLLAAAYRPSYAIVRCACTNCLLINTCKNTLRHKKIWLAREQFLEFTNFPEISLEYFCPHEIPNFSATKLDFNDKLFKSANCCKLMSKL